MVLGSHNTHTFFLYDDSFIFSFNPIIKAGTNVPAFIQAKQYSFELTLRYGCTFYGLGPITILSIWVESFQHLTKECDPLFKIFLYIQHWQGGVSCISGSYINYQQINVVHTSDKYLFSIFYIGVLGAFLTSMLITNNNF